MLIGTEGVYSYTFEHEKRDDCPVCGGEALDFLINPELTVERLIEMLVERQDVYVAFLSAYRNLTDLNVQGKSKNPHSPHRSYRSTSKPLHS